MNRCTLIIICILLLSVPLLNAACELPSEQREIDVVEENVDEYYTLKDAVVIQTSGAWEAGDLDDFVNSYVKQIFQNVEIEGKDYKISADQTIPITVVGAGGKGSGIAKVKIDGKFDQEYKGFKGTFNVYATLNAQGQGQSEPIDLQYGGEFSSGQVSEGELESILLPGVATLTFSGAVGSQVILKILGTLVGAAQEMLGAKRAEEELESTSAIIYTDYKTVVDFQIYIH